MHLRRLVANAFLASSLAPAKLMACTPAIGVDRDAFYRAIALPGRVASAVSLIAAVTWLIITKRWNTGRSRILIALGLVNPGWWLWDTGDCGLLAFVVGGAFALLSLGVLGFGLWHHYRTSRSTIASPGV